MGEQEYGDDQPSPQRLWHAWLKERGSRLTSFKRSVPIVLDVLF